VGIHELKDVRTATPADAAELADHVNAAYRGESSRAGWTTEADLIEGARTTRESLVQEMALPNRLFEILRDADGKILASVQLVRESSTCYLGMLTVRPTQQGGGIGKSFLAHSEAVAREWGCVRIRMTVINVRKELIAYYERRGYARTGVEIPFHGDPRFGGMQKVDFKMIELAKTIL